jgi:hypothetical protein
MEKVEKVCTRFVLSSVLTSIVNTFTTKLSIHALKSDAHNFDEVVESIPYDQSYTYEGLDDEEI